MAWRVRCDFDMILQTGPLYATATAARVPRRIGPCRNVGPVCGQMMVLERRKVRRLSLIDRYLARSIAVPLFGTLVLAAMLLVLDKMLRLFDFVASEGGPVSVVFKMLVNLIPEYAGLEIGRASCRERVL